ncbi:MAG TPA: patatin-like phospholipase family protein [Burkholderiales bacterium]|nr:patatin-like phospholipase family protein [Burkholderiales bacterium]
MPFPAMMKFRTRKRINLALQGGGSHGAFTWGVLDRLLEDERIDFEGISGTSAGAMNAVVLAHGLITGGRKGAREALAKFWENIANRVPFDPLQSGFMGQTGLTQGSGLPPVLKAMMGLTRFLSPYQLNPFDVNPLRDIVAASIDFERLRAECRLRLFIAATQVRTGKLRLFRTGELTAEAVLASACLPSLHHGIEIDGELYWDGGYSANPAIYPLFYHCRSRDVVIVILHPLRLPHDPSTAREIWNRVTELGFSATFLREMQMIAQAKRHVERSLFSIGRLERRLRHMNFHLVEAEELMSQLSSESKLSAHWPFICMLRDQGRARADVWLAQTFKRVGSRSSVDLTELFGDRNSG